MRPAALVPQPAELAAQRVALGLGRGLDRRLGRVEFRRSLCDELDRAAEAATEARRHLE